mmetsp:Transcript_7912/g.12570  ORF Transcript_7912/g.12570 Transcript_7912/m.12570 type:complete len:113 (+) Transcript_7912:272-610(+)
MVCCNRDGHDLAEEVYLHYFRDFPHEPLCLPGYVKDTGNTCIQCPQKIYCPATDDHVLDCPSGLWSRVGAEKQRDCWCPPGYYGEDEGGPNPIQDLVKSGGCRKCPANFSCP